MQVAYLADALYHSMAAGTARVTHEVARALADLPDIDLRLITLHRPEVVRAYAEKRQYPVAESIPGGPSKVGVQYLLWHLAGIPGGIARMTREADVVYLPLTVSPPRLRPPQVVTVLDMTFALFPQYHNRITRAVAGTGLRRAIREADAFIAISEHTRNDMVRMTSIPKERIHVVPLAADSRFSPQPDPTISAKYNIDGPYVLYVGTLEPRKNLTVLLKAFAAIKDRTTKLVFAGAKGWMYEEFMQSIQDLGLSERTIITGFIAHEDLPALISTASVFVYPSLYEGFGLPVLEAMQCGTPVITTNVSSIPEVAGDAALLIAPDDVAGLARHLDDVLASPDLQAEMRENGLEQARCFSWERTGEMTAEVFRRVVRG
jgi:glycosyltransferase involved in cell wall biosynthesis